jgi:hypothetical protein
MELEIAQLLSTSDFSVLNLICVGGIFDILLVVWPGVVFFAQLRLPPFCFCVVADII